MNDTTFKIYHDCQPHDASDTIISVANILLKEYGLKLNIEDDNLPHDGFIIMNVTLNKINNE